MKNNNELLLQLNKFEHLSDLEDYQIIDLANSIISSINLTQLKKSVNNACQILSGVTPPSFGADAVFIALDNQARLEIIYQLLHNCDFLETYVKNLKSNKNNCKENFDYIYSFVSTTIDLFKSVQNYGEFRLNEKKQNDIQCLKSQADKNLLKSTNN